MAHPTRAALLSDAGFKSLNHLQNELVLTAVNTVTNSILFLLIAGMLWTSALDNWQLFLAGLVAVGAIAGACWYRTTFLYRLRSKVWRAETS